MGGSWGQQRITGPNGKLPAGVITASGKMIDLADRKVVNAIGAMRMGWQTHAWDYRDLVPELSSAMRFRANAISKIGLKIGQVVEGEDEPIDADSEQSTLSPVVRKAAQDALNKLPWRSGYAFLGVLDTCFSIAGEGWLHGSTDPVTKKETWEVLSTDEVQPMGGGNRLGIVEIPGRAGRPIDPKTEVLIRLWVPHPRFKKLSDSPMRSLQDVLEDIILQGRELRSAARSRIAANGILFVTTNMSLRTSGGVNEEEDNDFVSDLTASIIAPITNEGEPGQVAPVIVEGDKEDIAAVKHISLVRETSADLNEKLGRSLTRMAESIDVPPTVVTGLQDTNHWNAYVIDATTFRNHLEPGVRMMVDAITEGYLRPSLIQPVTEGGYGLDPTEVEQVLVWYDAGKVTENANRAQDAKDAYDRFAIGGKSLRDALGFNEDDAPGDADLLNMILAKLSIAGPDPSVAGQLLAKLMPNMGIVPPPAPGTTPVPQHPVVDSAPSTNQVTAPQRAALPAHPDGQPGTGTIPHQNPSSPPTSGGGRVASGAPEQSLRIVDGRKLADIDMGLLDRLMVASEDAIQRALEKANARVRSAAQKKIDKGDLSDHAEDLVSWLGETGVAELGLTEEALLALAFAYLEGKFMEWTTDAIKNTVLAVAKILSLELTAVSSLRRTLVSRQKGAWERLHDQLKRRALARLYGKHGTEPHTGEEQADDVVRAGDIRTALAMIGGEPAGGVHDGGKSTAPLGGLALGSTVTEAISQKAGPAVGLMWVYGTDPRREFPPHKRLNDHRFNSASDKRLMTDTSSAWLGDYYHPGDHAGCFIGETVISGARPAHGFERPFTGEGIQIRTDAGNDLTGTANHPVLTPRGWVPLGELQEGDQLVIATGHQGSLAIDQEYQQMPARIDQVATTLPMAQRVTTAPVPSAPEDFHGDGSPVGGEVTVVRTDGGLLAHLESTGCQMGGDDVLQFAREREFASSSGCVTEALALGHDTASGGRVGSSKPGFDLSGGMTGVPGGLLVPRATPFDAETIKSQVDRATTDPIPSSKALDAFAGEVTLAKVVEVNRVCLTGHVFNVSTLTGWYVANGVVVSNCRCHFSPAWIFPQNAADLDPELRRAISDAQTPEASAMRDIRRLAEMDDAAGRTGTTAQQQRDQRDRILRLRDEWISGAA